MGGAVPFYDRTYGGFQLDVKGNTDLKGGVISSSQAAIDAGRNSLSTATLTASDIANHDTYKASSVSVGISGGGATPTPDGKAQPAGGGTSGGSVPAGMRPLQ